MEEKNEGHVLEGKGLAWIGEVLVSDEDRDGGSVGDKLGDGIDGGSECCTESTSKEFLSGVVGIIVRHFVGVRIVVSWHSIIVNFR